MKRFISVICVILCIAFISASCSASSGSNSDTESGSAGTQTKQVSMFDLSEEMKSATAFAESSYISNADDDADDLLSYVSDIDPEKLECWFDLYASSGADSTDEIAVLKVKDKADVSEAVSSLQAHVDSRIAMYRTYGADKVPSLEKALIFDYGNYAVLIVAEDSAAVKEAFINYVG